MLTKREIKQWFVRELELAEKIFGSLEEELEPVLFIVKDLHDGKTNEKINGKFRFNLFENDSPKIYIEQNIDRVDMIIALKHEIAHLFDYKVNQNPGLKHGKQFKEIFNKLMNSL